MPTPPHAADALAASLPPAYEGGEAPLHAAVLANDVDAIVKARDGGADVAKTDASGRTAVHVAAILGKLGAMQVLVRLGADMHAEDKNGDTALHIAAILGHVELVNAIRMQDARDLVISGVVGDEFYEREVQV